ncbi:MAG: Hpt domain-containing protein [Pirellulaceae bacterium]|nr:Hpt domain-containing protein [Pirellulaceae bacterium]
MTSITLDLEFTRANLDHDCVLLKGLMQIAVEDLPVLAAELRDAADGHDVGQLHHLGHAIKGLVSNFRAEPLTALAEQLEQATLGANGLCWTRLVDEVIEACENTSLALQAELRLAPL